MVIVLAEKNQTKLTNYEKESLKIKRKIKDEYKQSAEANVVSIIFKQPDLIHDCSLTRADFSNNVWKVYFIIAEDLIIKEQKSVLDDITIGIYLDKHEKLKNVYDENGGYKTLSNAMAYVHEENFESYITEIKKWNTILNLCDKGFPVADKISDFVDMSVDEIYDEYEFYLNSIFMDSSKKIESYNIFEGMFEFIEELNYEDENFLPLYNADLLNAEIGGFNYNGHIYGLGANSGVGKSTMAFNYLIPSAIKNNEKVVFIINEEDERKMKKELLVWVINNVIDTKHKFNFQKKILRDGNFSEENMNLLRQAAEWIENKKEEQIFTVIPLESYSVNTVIKIIKKYSGIFGVKIFVLDTFKESVDTTTDEIYKSMMRDMRALYDVIKPSVKNVGLFVTYQLSKGSVKLRHLTNNEIGQAKSIIDVMSVNLMMRRPYEDEYYDGSKALDCRKPNPQKWDKASEKSKIIYELKKENNPMITFITKNRFGETDTNQIISECDLSRNICKDVAYCVVPQDW